MGELNGRIDNTLQKAVNELSKELRKELPAVEITEADLRTKEEVVLRGEGKVGDLSMKLEKVIRRYV